MESSEKLNKKEGVDEWESSENLNKKEGVDEWRAVRS